MKLFVLFILTLSAQAFAKEVITCSNPSEPHLTYTLEEMTYDQYSLIVTKMTQIPESCRSRWGCDYLKDTIYKDLLEFTDVQGAWVFESKKTYIGMEDMDEVSYNYTVKTPFGTFVQKHATLKCRPN